MDSPIRFNMERYDPGRVFRQAILTAAARQAWLGQPPRSFPSCVHDQDDHRALVVAWLCRGAC